MRTAEIVHRAEFHQANAHLRLAEAEDFLHGRKLFIQRLSFGLTNFK